MNRSDPREARLRRWLMTCPGTIRRATADDCLVEARAMSGMMGVPLGEFQKMLEMAGHKPRSERIVNAEGKSTGYRAVLMLPQKPPE